MSFLQSLRMANIFPQQGETPFGMPDMNSGGNLSSLIGQIMPQIEAEKGRQRQHELEMLRQSKVPQIGQSMMQPEKKNVVYRPEMTPFQQQSLALRAQDIGQKGQYNEGRLASADADRNIRQQRADTYRMKAEGYTFDFRGPTVKAVHPSTGQVIDTGMPTGSMDEYEKIMLGQSNALERIGATGEQQRLTEGERQKGRAANIEARGNLLFNDAQGNPVRYNVVRGGDLERVTENEGQPVTGPLTRPGTGSSQERTDTPTQARVRQYTAAEQLINSGSPLAKYIKLNPRTKTFTITDTGKDWLGRPTGPTEQERQQINQSIYQGGIPIQQPTRTGTPTPNVSSPTRMNPVSSRENLDTKAPPEGARPGGRWVSTKYGNVYQEP
jgi:hypothetical protein